MKMDWDSIELYLDENGDTVVCVDTCIVDESGDRLQKADVYRYRNRIYRKVENVRVERDEEYIFVIFDSVNGTRIREPVKEVRDTRMCMDHPWDAEWVFPERVG